ncbi:MAG TPA: ankyrin repeat domain-containing protein [Pyrinomonadaceae bacterium]|jgi:ankyrin repeat protein
MNKEDPAFELLKAASEGRAGDVRALLEKGVSANAKDKFGNTALIFAAACGHLPTVSLLLEHGADAAAQNQVGMTAATRAAESDTTR